MVATLKSMSVTLEDSEMLIALLNGLPDRFDSLISALDASHTDDKHLTFELVQSRCLQEEQRHNDTRSVMRMHSINPKQLLY